MTHHERQVLVAAQIMTRSVITVHEAMEIHAAINVLVSRKISGAPVVDDDGKLCGVLSGKDCLRVLASDSFHEDHGGKVSDYMSKTVATITPDTDLYSIAHKFLNSHYRRLPVLDGDRLVGMVSRGDALRGIQTMEAQLKLRSYPDYRRPSAPEKLKSGDNW